MRSGPSLRCLPVLLAGLAVAGPVAAQLADKSPFLPGGVAAAGAAGGSGSLEYRGFLETKGGRQFRLYDPARKLGVWVRLNEPNQELGVTAKRYDGHEATLTIEQQGKVVTLAERQSRVISGAAPAAPAPVVAVPTVAPAVTQSVVLNPTPADEQRRLDAVAAEVQRRRALREQAAPAAPQPAPAPGVQPR
jgi:hypothetical protein